MALTTYTDLQNSVAGWLNRSDLAAVAPDFIALAEAEFNRKLRVRQMIVPRDVITISAQDTALPSDFLQTTKVQLTGTTPKVDLIFRTPELLDTEMSKSNALAQPVYYTILGSNLTVCPVPDTSYTAELAYYQQVPALATHSTNWLLTKHPDLYLYGSLSQSAPYLKDDDRIPMWKAAYMDILESILLEETRATYNGGTPLVVTRGIG